MRKVFKISKKIALVVLTFAFVLIAIGVLPSVTPGKNPNKVILSADTWNSDLVEINKGDSLNTSTYVSISSYVTLDGDGLVTAVKDYSAIDANTIVKIETGLDLYYFSELCNPKFSSGNDNAAYKDFLGFNYIVACDINYEDASKTFKMLRPIGWMSGAPFTGTFDGQGNVISNIFYRPLEDETEAETYSGLIYFALFSVISNQGTVRNVGIVNPNMIQYDKYEDIAFVSPLIGDNNGLVENCYVQDFRGNNAGMSAEGGYTTSMFAVGNGTSGIIRNCYVAVDRITSPTISMTSASNRYPFIAGNKGTLENCYYDNHILDLNTTYTKPEKDSETAADFVGLEGITTADFLNTSVFEYYEKDDADNIVNQIWFSNATYETNYSSYLRLNYPVLKGFEVKEVNSVKYFAIKDANDLVLMSEYIDKYQAFRTASYLLVNSVDLKTVKQDAFVFTDAVFSGKLVGTTKSDDGYSVTLSDGTVSNQTSIFNLKINKGNSYNGYRCYGLFSVLAGTVEGINLVNVTIDESDITSVNLNEVNTLGAVCGLLEGGIINKVNVSVNITLTNGTTTFLGTQQVGGICGTTLSGTISNSTTTGTLNAATYSNTGTLDVKYSHSIGGIVGKVENCDSISNCLNNIELNNINYSTNPGTSVRQYIGGAIGCGGDDDVKKESYLSNTYELQNNKAIKVTNGTYYSLVYVGGVIGRVIDAKGSNGVYLNNADINFDVNNNNYKAYISGVMNVISKTADGYDTFNKTINATTVQSELDAQTAFEFTSISNAGLLNINNELSASKYPAKYGVITTITNGIDIRAAGLCYSYLSKMNVLGGYNLNYHYERTASSIKEVANEPQSIDMSMMDEYAPAFNADNKVAYLDGELHLDTNYLPSKSTTIDSTVPTLETTVNLERVYNYQQSNYISNKAVNAYTLQISGCINGRNFNLKNIRNDGAIKVYFTQSTLSLGLNASPYFNYFGDYKKLKVYGVMEEVSLGHRAEDIYNGGNITISSADGIVPNFTMYIGGVCYKNVGNDDPGTSLMIERGYVGSLHNTINNGEIRITHGNILESDQTASGQFYSQSRIGGICAFNCSTISQTFNLGDIYNVNSVFRKNDSTYGSYPAASQFEVETGGICFIQQNELLSGSTDNGNAVYTKANIIDSANNGTVISLNTGTNNAWTNAGGFVGRNDRGEDAVLVEEDDTSSVYPHLQKIQYCINYGDVYSYNNYSSDNETTANEPQAKAAGFICLGLCSVVDVINYGDIHSTKVASGMFGHVYFPRMVTAGASQNSPVNIANAINYGKVTLVSVSESNRNQLYSVNDETGLAERTGIFTTSANSTHYPVGALIGMIYGNNNANTLLTTLNVKNLVNFNDDLDILGRVAEGGIILDNNNNKIEALQYMATTKPADFSPDPFGTDRTNYYSGVKSYFKDDSLGDNTVENSFSQAYNGGIFNQNYTLRTAPAFTYDVNGNVDQNNTDNFIADYIQFIPYSKVNEYLVKKIGLESVVLENALNRAKDSYETIYGILKYKNSTDTAMNEVYDELIAEESERLDSASRIIARELSNTLSSPEYTVEEVREILKVLIEHEEELNQVCQATLVKNIITGLVNKMTETEIDSTIKAVLVDDDLLYILVVEYPDVFADYIEIVKESSNLTSEQKAAIAKIFECIVHNNGSVKEYINSLTKDEQDALADELYEMLKNNQVIRDNLASVYSTLDISGDKLEEFKDFVLESRIDDDPTNNLDITDSEYENMYADIKISNKTDEQVYDGIRSLTGANLTNFINSLKAGASEHTSRLYSFLDSGRTNSGNIYLPATEGNYIGIVNSSNYVFKSDIGTAGTGEVYSGNIENVNFAFDDTNRSYTITPTLDPAHAYEIYVSNADQGGKTYVTESSSITYYWYWELTNGTLSLSHSETVSTQNRYFVANKPSNGSTPAIANIEWGSSEHTGVFADGENDSETGTDYFWGFIPYDVTLVSDLLFSNISIYKYINYSSNQYLKNNKDLTLSMIEALSDATLSDNHKQAILLELFSKSTVNKGVFIQLLFADERNGHINDGTTLEEKVQYVIDNLTPELSYTALENISDEDVRITLVQLFGIGGSVSFSGILDVLLQQLSLSTDETYINKVDELYNDVFVQGAPGFTKGEQDAIYDAIRLIINSLNADQKKELALDMPGVVGPYAIKNGINSLTKQEIIELINQFIIANPQLLVTDHNELSTLFDLNIKATISAGIIYGDENLFIKHIFSGNSLDELIQLMNDAKLDAGLITDFTGIYALASSMGIEAGLFLPDNISLIDLDKYYTNEDGILVNDPEWRGGTYEEPNAYTEGVRSVNYKVYYEMKQLKKSIATIIFKMELTDDDNELAVDNNVETDYFCNVKEKDENGNLVVDEYGNHIILNEVYFYIPINNDILYKDYLYINMTKGTYELSYGAKFDEGTDKFEIELPKENYFVGQILYDTFIVEAEDEKVKTKYTLYVTITNPAYLDPLNSVTVDGVASATTISTKSGLKGETVTDAIVNTAVVGYNGKIVLNYGTVNMTNGLSLLSNVNVYKTNLSVLPTALPTNYSSYTTNKLIKGTDYVFNDVVNNGIVVITGVSGTGFENNSYPDGTIFFDISLDNYQSAGIYLIEIEINDDAKYYTFFEKAKSSMANLESLTFDGQYYVNESNSNDNSDAPSLLQFGTPVTEEFFANSGVLNNNLYIDSIEGVLNGDFFNTDANKVCIYKKGDSNITNANQSYRIAIKLNPLNNKYEITNKYTSGDGQDVTTLDFDYLIMIPSSHVDRVTFNNVAIGDICDISNSGTTCNITFNKGLYLDSILTSPLSTFTIGEVTATKVGELYQYTVEIKIIAEDGTPKTFTHYINEETYNDYITRIYVNGGVEVDDIIGDDAAEQAATYAYEDTFEKTETPSYRFEYSLDHFYTLPTSSYFKVQFYDASGNELPDIPTGVTVNVTEGLDFEVEFSEDAESTDYYFAMVYQNSVEFNDTQTNGWDVEFKKIHIKKQKSRNSYLDNITFFSESVTASIRTMITADVITLTEYEAMLKDSTREIVCLPGQIYYNDYAWSYSDNTMEKESDFYVIGLVNRTELDYYTPDFTLPEGATVYRTETVEGAIYKYVPYYVDDLQALTNFLISEDGNTILDEGGNAITVTNASTGFSSFTYNGINYTISPVAGYQSIVYNETTIENTSLRTNYNEFGSYDEDAEEFNFVNYRVYAEIYSELTTDADKANHVTDYKVAAQDLTNNIRFNLTIQYADGCDINEKVKNIFVEFVCYALPAEVTKENPDRSEYLLYNKAGIFAYFDGDNILSHGSLKSNTSGYYDLFISLPDGYKASFTVTDKKVTTTYTDTNEFFVDTGITVRNVDIVITIDKVDNYTPEWGVHVKNESNSK